MFIKLVTQLHLVNRENSPVVRGLCLLLQQFIISLCGHETVYMCVQSVTTTGIVGIWHRIGEHYLYYLYSAMKNTYNYSDLHVFSYLGVIVFVERVVSHIYTRAVSREPIRSSQYRLTSRRLARKIRTGHRHIFTVPVPTPN